MDERGKGSGSEPGGADTHAFQSNTARIATRFAAWFGLPLLGNPDRQGWRARPLEGADKNPANIAAAIREGRAMLAERDGETRLFLSPCRDNADWIAALQRGSPDLASRVTIVTSASIRRMLISAHRVPLLQRAATQLVARYPSMSAVRLVTWPQAIALLLLLGGLAGSIALVGASALALVDIFASLLFLAAILLRMEAIGLALHRRRQRPQPMPRFDEADLPVYTILLPLHDEAQMVGQLVSSINALEWPKDRLDIKLIVEEDDAGTIAAIRRLKLPSAYEMVRVPALGPRTKPKALAFALQFARGDYVTVYDAEDRPDPLQLMEAYAAFLAAGPELGCVQAPLVIDNADQNGLTALFALEYSVQFDGLLPLLAAFGLPLPLGGTSNHFRRTVLEAVGGWDPFNVTEDADLGIRLARFGYQSAMIERPTFEAAPRRIQPWLNQRTRWMKGWMQTLIVHMRNPLRLVREIGWKGSMGFLITSLGSLVAAAIHPLYLATVLAALTDPLLVLRADTPLLATMTALNLFNFVAAYGVFAMLSRQTFLLRGMKRPSSALIYLPGYWLLLSLACYRAIIQLVIAPHYWSKTPHLPTIEAEAPDRVSRVPAGAGDAVDAVVTARTRPAVG